MKRIIRVQKIQICNYVNQSIQNARTVRRPIHSRSRSSPDPVTKGRQGAFAPCLPLVPVVGLEPTRHRWQRILSPPRLPFQHTGMRAVFYNRSGKISSLNRVWKGCSEIHSITGSRFFHFPSLKKRILRLIPNKKFTSSETKTIFSCVSRLAPAFLVKPTSA